MRPVAVLAVLTVGLTSLSGAASAQTGASAPPTEPATWVDTLSGYAGTAMEMLGMAPESAPAGPSANGSDGAPPSGTDWQTLLGQVDTQQLQGLVQQGWSLLGSADTAATAPAGADPVTASSGGGWQDQLAGLFGGGEIGTYLAQIFQSISAMTAEQRDALLNGVTTQIPNLMADAQRWWNGLTETKRAEYLDQINQVGQYLYGLVQGPAATTP